MLILLRIFLIGSLALLSGCSGGGGGGGGGPAPVVAPAALSYSSPLLATVGTPIQSLSPTVTGSVASYSVSPALPAGLSLNTSSGVVSGTPSGVSAASSYVITASNVSGSATFGLSITVNLPALAWDQNSWDQANWQ